MAGEQQVLSRPAASTTVCVLMLPVVEVHKIHGSKPVIISFGRIRAEPRAWAVAGWVCRVTAAAAAAAARSSRAGPPE